MSRSWTRVLWASAWVLGFAVTGCVVEPDQRHYADGVVMVAPPPPQVEVVGDPPQPGFVWIAGYWNWVGGRHVWVGGHWVAGRDGYHWVAHTWVRHGHRDYSDCLLPRPVAR
jgi:hypothetical protein